MIKREASATIRFRHYLRAHPFDRTTWYEVKQTRIDSISFSAVEEHQLDWLLASKHGHTNYKIPDDSRGVKPVDGIFTKESDAVIVIKYPKCFCIIDVDDFIEIKKNSFRKSLTEEKARGISQKVVDL
jgi:hypothetical protein